MSEARTRPSLFQDDPSPAPAVDLGRFAAKPALAADAPAADTIRRISDEGGFPSRAPTTAKPAMPTVPTPPKLGRYKSGRTAMLNARLTQRAHDRYHEIVAAEQERFRAGELTHNPTLGEIVERALAALEREIAGKGAP